LTFSLLVATITLGVMSLAWNLEWPAPQGIPLLVHTSAVLCVLWAGASHIVARSLTLHASDSRRGDLVAVLHIGSLATGLVTVILMVYVAVIETLFRTLEWDYEATPQLKIWSGGFVDLVLVAAAILFTWRHTRDGQLWTALFWVGVLGSLWAAYQLPVVRLETTNQVSRWVSTHWPAVFTSGCAAMVGGFTLIAGLMARRNRRQHLLHPERLREPPPEWPGYRYSAGLVGVGVLILGCAQLVFGWTGPAALVTGAAMLALAHRSWNENLADTGLALITLGIVALILIPLGRRTWWTPDAWAGVYNQVLIGLAVMTAFWYWLADVWEQQLDHGRAWTTAGRLIPITRRIGYLAGAAGVLVSLNLSIWPKFEFVFGHDNSTGRWVWGLLGNGLLIASLLYATRRVGRSTVAWLALLAGVSVVMFAMVRIPHTRAGRAWHLYWPVALTAFSAVMVIIAILAERSKKWRAFEEPAYLGGVFAIPLAAIAGLTLTEQIRLLPWVPACTWTGLAAVYALAAWRPGPRALLAVALLCGMMAVWSLRRLHGSYIIAPAYFLGMISALSITLATVVIHRRRPTVVSRVLLWVGGTITLGCMIAGILVARS
jgi:hypothetical protein